MTDKGPGDILKLSRNFMESRILLSAAELNLSRCWEGVR